MFRFLNLILIFIIVLLQVRLWTGEGSLPENWHLERQIEAQEVITDRLEKRNAVLAAEVKDLRSGLDSIEERARYELGMVRENETFFLLVDETDVQPALSGPSAQSPARLSASQE